MATPIGVLAGTYLAEYGKSSKLAMIIRFVNDILLAAPSILIGLFVYMLMVQPMGGYSGWAGGVALAIIAVPVHRPFHRGHAAARAGLAARSAEPHSARPCPR